MKINTTYFTCFLLTVLFFIFHKTLKGQATNNFEASPAGTNVYVDVNSPTISHTLVNNALPQTQPSEISSGSMLGYSVTFQPSRTGTSGSAGLTDGDLFGAVDVTVPASASNDMGNLSINYTDDPAPQGGNKVYVLEDSDGLAILSFDPIDLTGTTNPIFSMDFILNSTSYENSDGADDRIKIYLDVNNGTSEIVLFEFTNDVTTFSGFVEEDWQNITYDLSANIGGVIQLIIEFDTNAGTEEMHIDNVSFSQGSIGEPMCTDPDLPTLTHIPNPVCEGLPFTLGISGSLNDASTWKIYSDMAATQLIDSTSANEYYLNNAQSGLEYFVRGEGGCVTPGSLASISITLNASANCNPSNTPGTSFEEPLGFSSSYFDTLDQSTTHQLVNYYGQPTVDFTAVATEIGFRSFFTPSRTGTSNVGLTDGDEFGVSDDDATYNFPDGSQAFIVGDPDGLVTIEFNPIDLSGVADPGFSFQYLLNGTTYESSDGADDFVRVYIKRNNGQLSDIDLINATATGGILPNLITDAWTTVSTTTGQINMDEIVQLIIEVDFNSASEKILFDDLIFSGGTIQPFCEPVVAVCQDITVYL